MVLLASLGFLSTLAVVVIFWRHAQTPVVRSAGGPMCFLMLAGRLELFPILALFHPAIWRKQ